MGAVLALLASASWGTSDFLGGTLSRRAHPLVVMVCSQGTAMIVLLTIAAAVGDLRLSGGYLPWGIAAGLSGAIGLGCFYTALSRGTMGTVAPVAACGVVVPVVIALVRGEAPSILEGIGILVAAVGVVLVSGPERGPDGARRDMAVLGLSMVAAVGFGLALTFIALGAKHNLVMTMAAMRCTNVLLVGPVVLVLLHRHHPGPRRSDVGLVMLIAAGDTGANGLYAFATHIALVSVSAVLASLYPAVTTILAWRFHRERLRPIQIGGFVATLAGVALIAAGGA